MIREFQVGVKGRDFAQVKAVLDGEQLESVSISAVGCLDFLKALAVLKQNTPGNLQGLMERLLNQTHVEHVDILMRELVLKLKNEWVFPYAEAELCHCRAISTEKVDQAVVYGARTVMAVNRLTSAGTACGTCRPDIEKILSYRVV